METVMETEKKLIRYRLEMDPPTDPTIVQKPDSVYLILFVDHEPSFSVLPLPQDIGLELTFLRIVHKEFDTRWCTEIQVEFLKRIIDEDGTKYLVELDYFKGIKKLIRKLAEPILAYFPNMSFNELIGKDGKMLLKIDENVEHEKGYELNIFIMEHNPHRYETFYSVAIVEIGFYVDRCKNQMGYFFKTKSIRFY